MTHTRIRSNIDARAHPLTHPHTPPAHPRTHLGPSGFEVGVLLYYAEREQAPDFVCPPGASCPGAGRMWYRN